MVQRKLLALMRYYGIIRCLAVWCLVVESEREKGENFKGRRCRGTLHRTHTDILRDFFEKPLRCVTLRNIVGVKIFYYKISPFWGKESLEMTMFIHICTWEGKNVFRIVLSFIIEPFFLLFLSLSPTYVVFVALSTLSNDCDDDDDDFIVVDGMAWQHGWKLVMAIISHQFNINTQIRADLILA